MNQKVKFFYEIVHDALTLAPKQPPALTNPMFLLIWLLKKRIDNLMYTCCNVQNV